jgi:hypothetical protein
MLDRDGGGGDEVNLQCQRHEGDVDGVWKEKE